MAAPLEHSGFYDARHAGRLRRSVFIARRARAGRRAGGGGRTRIGLMMLVPMLLLPFAVAAAVVLGATRFYDNAVRDLDTPANMLAAVANYGGAQIYDRNGVLLHRFPESDGGFRFPARLDEVSKAMIDATVSTEDQNFWSGNGVDYRSTLGAAYENFRATGNPFSGRGASGITQQLVKQTLITPEDRTAQSVTRKLQEAIYATEVANHYSKEQILEWYLNVINYGGVYNGVETAAQGYFGVHASELTLAQAAMLAGIPQSPALHSPYFSWEGAKWRQAEVLDLMVMHDYITQADAAKRDPIELKPQEESLPLRAPWFVEYIRQELVARFGERCVQRCGLSVTMTVELPVGTPSEEE